MFFERGGAWKGPGSEDTPLAIDIVITGMGLVSPFGLGEEPFAEGLKKNQSAIRRVTRFPLKDWCRPQLAAEVKDFPFYGRNEALEDLTGNLKESERAFPRLRLVWASLALALKDAGLALDARMRERTGIFVGLSRLSIDSLEFFLERSSAGRLAEIMPFRLERVHPHGVAGHLSHLYQIVGPCLSFPASCQSALQALETAMLCLENGLIDLALVLSTDTISRFLFHAEAAAGLLSAQPDPDRAPRPYDDNADGAVLSEGGAALVLEKAGGALGRGARIRARISALETVFEPAPFPPLKAGDYQMGAALSRLFERFDASRLDLIYGGGRGIQDLDRSEAESLQRILGNRADRVLVTSVQGGLGHAGGTGALFQTMAAVWSLESGWIPAIRNLENPTGGCQLNYVTGNARQAAVNRVLVLTYGWGGSHSALVLQKG